MKKIMFMAAIVCAAVAAQAAQYDWKSSTAVYGVNAAAVTDNGDYAAGTTYMRNNGTWNVILALYDTTTHDLVGQSSSTGVKFSSTGNKFNTAGITVAEAELGTTYDYVLTITGTQTSLTSRGEDTAAGFDYSGATLTTTISGTIATDAMGKTTLTSAVPSTWTISGITALSGGGDEPGGNVPEPTSGLLMLVGLGALALRRRR